MPHNKNTPHSRNPFHLTLLAALIGALFCPLAHATSFNIGNGQTVTAQQTLNANETGVIQSGGILNASETVVVNDSASSTRNFTLAIHLSGNGTTVTNNGAIRTAGGTERTAGIVIGSGANDITIINNGSITTIGGNSFNYGIRSYGARSSIFNNGSITVTRENATKNAYGIYTSDDDAAVTNSGTITVTITGTRSAFGIFSTGDNATITHSGTITVTGANAIGIYSDTTGGETATINVSGSITATGSATQAIVGEDGNETLNLYSGANITGTIDLGDGNDTLNLYSGATINGTVDLGAGTNVTNIVTGGVASTSMTIPTISSSGGGTNTINQTGEGLAFLDSGSNTLHFVDTTNLTVDQTMLGNVTSGISGAINQQLNKTPALPKPVKVASARMTPDMLPFDTGPIGWGSFFGKHEKRGSNGAALGYTDNTFGMVGGYEQSYNGYRVGLFGGVSHSNADTETASIKNDNDSFFVGVYGQHSMDDDWYLNGSLSVGYVSYNSERQVAVGGGNETALSDYHGIYLSPSVSVMRKIERGAGFSWRPSVELNYAYGRLSSYAETGTTSSNLSVGSRNVSAFNTRVQLAAHQELINRKGEVEFRGGLTHTNYGSDNVQIALQGTSDSKNYDISGTDSVTGVYVGANTRIHWKKNLNFVGDLEFTRANHDGYTLMGYVGVECLF